MLYWGIDELVSAVSIVLCVIGFYVAFDLTRVASGAPRAWYWIIGGVAALLVYEVARLYYESRAPGTFSGDLQVAILLVCDIFLVAGLTSLDFNFRRQLKAVGPGQTS